jgi:hypothetical protein
MNAAPVIVTSFLPDIYNFSIIVLQFQQEACCMKDREKFDMCMYVSCYDKPDKVGEQSDHVIDHT